MLNDVSKWYGGMAWITDFFLSGHIILEYEKAFEVLKLLLLIDPIKAITLNKV